MTRQIPVAWPVDWPSGCHVVSQPQRAYNWVREKKAGCADAETSEHRRRQLLADSTSLLVEIVNSMMSPLTHLTAMTSRMHRPPCQARHFIHHSNQCCGLQAIPIVGDMELLRPRSRWVRP